MKTPLTILGSTGSIGVNTLDVVARHAEKFEVFALSANKNMPLLIEQCRQFKPRYAMLADETKYAALKTALDDCGDDCETEAVSGDNALVDLAGDARGGMLISGIVGSAGLKPLLGAARAGKRILFANKEAIVIAGGILKRECEKSGAQLLPLDSEHNAVLQCLNEQKPTTVTLTASGGPFLNTPIETFAEVTPEMACAHPNWDMGDKISIDSATLMNKGLEVIEAIDLFDLGVGQVNALIHPQSIVHALVGYADGSFIAQLAMPDMRIPIASALMWPERMDSGAPTLDLAAVGHLSFDEIDTERFPCFKLAMDVLSMPRGARVVLNSANEEAVDAFLKGALRFNRIIQVVETAVAQLQKQMTALDADNLDDILELDTEARRCARQIVQDLN